MRKCSIIFLVCAMLFSLTACTGANTLNFNVQNTPDLYDEPGKSVETSIKPIESQPAQAVSSEFSLNIVATYPDPVVPYEVVNDNVPYFTAADSTTNPFETYSNLDSLGRCGVAYANICVELMPTEERGEIGMIKPSGWHTVRYDDLVDGNYLYTYLIDDAFNKMPDDDECKDEDE